jgi:hypothetical protein
MILGSYERENKSLNRGRDKIERVSEEIASPSLIFKETKQIMK